MASSLRLKAIHLCDSVQRDARGLPSLNSIYPGFVTCPLRPWYQKFAVFFVFERHENEDCQIQIRVTAPSASSMGELEVESGSAYFDLNMSFSLLVPDEGSMRIDWKTTGGRWKKAAIWDFRFPEKVKKLSKSDEADLRKFYASRMKIHGTLEDIELCSLTVKY